MKKGFTLIELLVVVLIIGILSSVALPQYQKSVDRAKGVEALTAAKAIADAENIYYLENGSYDPSISRRDFSLFSIDLPELKNWDIGTAGGEHGTCDCEFVSGCSDSKCAFLLKEDMGSGTTSKAILIEYLEAGKHTCRCCKGEKCQNYFGVKSGEEF